MECFHLTGGYCYDLQYHTIFYYWQVTVFLQENDKVVS